MGRLYAPITRQGGKGRLVYGLLPLIPSHSIYVEPFCGAASLFFAKQSCKVEVLNDTDKALIAFFRMLRTPKDFEKFQCAIYLTPYSRVEYYSAYDWREESDEIERLRKWFIISRQAFGGNYGSGWSFDRRLTSVSRTRVGSWLRAVERLPEVVERLREAQIDCLDFRQCITRYDSLETFFYLDPPYLPEVRKYKDAYKHEMTLQDHEDLIDLLLKLKGKALLSGYRNDLYVKLENAGWFRKDFKSFSGLGRSKSHPESLPKRIESVWLNYAPD